MKKTSQNIILLHLKNIILFFSIIGIQANAQTKIIANSGDTLLKISRQYGVPLKDLMYKNNFNDATRLVEGEVIVIPQNNNKDIKVENLIYKVVEGDTLYKIARDHNVKSKDIIAINNLEDNSIIEIGQDLILPKGAVYNNKTSKKNIKETVKEVFFHQTSKPEDISFIANIHKISIEKIYSLNNINDALKIKPNVKLKLREPKPSKWLRYGTLTINWSDWTYLDNNYITQAKTNKNKPFYLALNCKKRVLNNTLNKSNWTIWYFPETDFEFKLINDFCEQDSKD